MALDLNRGKDKPRSQAQAEKPGKPPASPKPGFLSQELALPERKPGLNERMVFTERLLLLLETGVSLLEALQAMNQQAEQPGLNRIILALAETINEGKTFAVALSLHPEMFSSTYVSLVAAAEEGGFLPEVLQQLLDMDEKAAQLRSTLISTLSYPAFLIVFSIAVVVFVLVVIFPKFEDLFSGIRDQLPLSTLMLMAASNFLRQYALQIVAGLALAVWALIAWMRSPEGRRIVDQLKLRLPLVGDLYARIYLSKTLGVLGLSLSNGVPITIALKACQDVVGNAAFGAFIEDVRTRVNDGRGIAAGFQNAHFVPPMVRQMIATGEQTGNLGKVMSRIAVFYEREISKKVTLMSKAVEPVMLLVMGVVVGVIVASLILPIFKLSSSIS
ncbi:MAG: type II secretion system F family protein [Azonexus sp.]|nr:type II secretion system F family protein [Azonexus sp.]